MLRGHTDQVASVCIAPGGSWLASAGADRSLCIWPSRHDGDEDVQPHKLEAAHGRGINALAVDAKWIVSGSDDRLVKLWSVEPADDDHGPVGADHHHGLAGKLAEFHGC